MPGCSFSINHHPLPLTCAQWSACSRCEGNAWIHHSCIENTVHLWASSRVRIFPTVMFMLTPSTASYHSLDVILTGGSTDKPHGIFLITQYVNRLIRFKKIYFVSVWRNMKYSQLKLVYKNPNKLSLWWGYNRVVKTCFLKPLLCRILLYFWLGSFSRNPTTLWTLSLPFISPPAGETREAAGIKRPSTTSLGKQSLDFGRLIWWMDFRFKWRELNKMLVLRPSLRHFSLCNSVHLVGSPLFIHLPRCWLEILRCW